MGLFKKGADRDELIKQGIADAEAAAAADQQKDANEVKTGNDKVDIELTKIYAQLESFGEIRKANAERFSRISEQLGEVRGMIVDTNKAMSKIEVASTKAVDLVESVHPEKLMIEVRKSDGKVEALRANIESNEAIMKDLMGEVKKMREQMNFYKGIEQVAALNDEVKTELANIKKMEAVIERHADKVETIFLEVEKKFSQFDKFDSIVKDLESSTKKLGGDFDKSRVKLDQKEEKKEFVSLVDKFNDFEKHTTNLLKLLDERSKSLKDGLEKDFKKLKRRIERQLRTGPIDMDAPEPEAGPKAGKPAGTPAREGAAPPADAAGEAGSGQPAPEGSGADGAGAEKQEGGEEGASKGAAPKGAAPNEDASGGVGAEGKPSEADQGAGADVAGGDVKLKKPLFKGIFKRKIVDKPLDGGADASSPQDAGAAAEAASPVQQQAPGGGEGATKPVDPKEEKKKFEEMSIPPEGSAALKGKEDSEFAKDDPQQQGS